jgi:hypothetical protein
MHRYPIATAAQLAEASYKAETHPSVAPRIARSLDHGDVEAHLLDNGVLLVPGSNSLMDYLRFNLRPLMVGGTQYQFSDDLSEKGHSGTFWHQGFFRHAKAVHDWVEAGGTRPVYVIGHSLGAAAVQILTKSWRIPGIGFAAPRPRKHDGPLAHTAHCLCINRTDDLVCDLASNYHHVGTVHAHAGAGVFGPDHAMRHYRRAVTEAQGAGALPRDWPPRA